MNRPPHDMSFRSRRTVLGLLALASACLSIGAASVEGADAPDAYHLLYFGTQGPLFVRLQVEASGRTLGLIREQYLDLLFFSLDRNRDARLDEHEAANIPADGRFGRGKESVGDHWHDFDTSPQDGVITADELKAGISPRLGTPFQSRDRPPRLTQSVQLYSRLDTDADRRLTPADFQSALENLRAFDFDDDETLSAAELQPFPQSMLAAAMAQERGEERRPFVTLDADQPLEPLADRLLTMYAGPEAAGLAWKSVELDRRAFAAADLNRDRQLDRTELVEFLKSPPVDVDVLVDLSRSQVRLSSKPRSNVHLLETGPSRGLALEFGAERLEFATDINFGFNDSVALLMTTRFRTADGDSNGSLNPGEYEMLGGLDVDFTRVDFDGDGEILPAELERCAMLDARLVQSSVEMSIQRRDPQPLFGLLDANSDRRLTAREFHDAVQRPRARAEDPQTENRDGDGDGGISEDELHEQASYRLSFSFGVPSILREGDRDMMMMNAAQRLPIVNEVSAGPAWFQKMDRNQDGDLSWREFLGPRAAFSRLDADGSGWIDPEEADREP